jgi:hypothetical protein
VEHDNCLKRHRRRDKITAEFDRYHNLVLQACKARALLIPKLDRRGLIERFVLKGDKLTENVKISARSVKKCRSEINGNSV